jgi:dipeptide/tripeptide permease
MSEGMTPASGSAPMTEKVNLAYHAIIGAAVGVTAAFTAFAWVPAIVVGYIVGRDQAERLHGLKARPALNILRALGIVIGVGLMLFLGAIVGGLVAIIIVALVAFSERLAANAPANDQMIARILVVLLGTVIWIVFFSVLKPNISINIGG